MKRIETETKIINVVYEGNCPICGVQQRSPYQIGIDKLCLVCSEKERIRLMQSCEGGTVVYSSFEYIVVKTKENEIVQIDRNYDYPEDSNERFDYNIVNKYIGMKTEE